MIHSNTHKYCNFEPTKELMHVFFYTIILVFFISCLSTTLFAQQKTVNGMIVVDFKTETPSEVLISNKNSGVYAISDLTGSFKIKAAIGDTLHFQGTFLQDRKFLVRSSTFEYNPIVIHMNYEVITLADVIAKPRLTGDMRKDLATVEANEDVEKIYANLGIDIRTLDMQPKERKEDIIPKLGGIPIPTSLNVEALYKTITGYYRRMENLNQFERLEKRLLDVKDYLGIKYFEQTLGIAEPDIRGFLLYVYDHSQGQYEMFYLQKDFLSMDKLLRSIAPEFRKRIEERDSK